MGLFKGDDLDDSIYWGKMKIIWSDFGTYFPLFLFTGPLSQPGESIRYSFSLSRPQPPLCLWRPPLPPPLPPSAPPSLDPQASCGMWPLKPAQLFSFFGNLSLGDFLGTPTCGCQVHRCFMGVYLNTLLDNVFLIV